MPPKRTHDEDEFEDDGMSSDLSAPPSPKRRSKTQKVQPKAGQGPADTEDSNKAKQPLKPKRTRAPKPRAGVMVTYQEKSVSGNPVPTAGNLLGSVYLPAAAKISQLQGAAAAERDAHLLAMVREQTLMMKAFLQNSGAQNIPSTPAAEEGFTPGPATTRLSRLHVELNRELIDRRNVPPITIEPLAEIDPNLQSVNSAGPSLIANPAQGTEQVVNSAGPSLIANPAQGTEQVVTFGLPSTASGHSSRPVQFCETAYGAMAQHNQFQSAPSYNHGWAPFPPAPFPPAPFPPAPCSPSTAAGPSSSTHNTGGWGGAQ